MTAQGPTGARTRNNRTLSYLAFASGSPKRYVAIKQGRQGHKETQMLSVRMIRSSLLAGMLVLGVSALAQTDPGSNALPGAGIGMSRGRGPGTPGDFGARHGFGMRQSPSLLTMPNEILDKLGLSDDEISKILSIRYQCRQKIWQLAPSNDGGATTTDASLTFETSKPLREAAEAEALGSLQEDHRMVVEAAIKHMKTLHSVRLPANLVLNLKLSDDQYAQLDALAPVTVTPPSKEFRDKVQAVLTDEQNEIVFEWMQSNRSQPGPGMAPGMIDEQPGSPQPPLALPSE